MQAVDKEYDELEERIVWDTKGVREKEEVRKEAQIKDMEVHFGRIFATCTEKDFEMIDEAMRKYKGRVCFDGREQMVRNQWYLRAAFKHLQSVPASMAASKNGIAYGQLPGHYITTADAKKAYCQSEWDGTPTWVELPEHKWPKEWKGKFTKPVCPLKRNLYGHPQAGPRYERWAKKQLISIGFEPIENWPGVFYQTKTRTMIVLYVDDLIMAGPNEFRDQVCKQVEGIIELGDWTPLGRYLGCHHDVKPCTDNDEFKGATKTVFQMHDYLAGSIEKYKELTGVTNFKKVASPALDVNSISDEEWTKPSDFVKTHEEAASILMSVFYAARIARWELLYPTAVLTRYLTKWTKAHDKMLKRLMDYIYHHLDDCLTGYVGDKTDDLYLGLYVDADHGGDKMDVKATTGAILVLRGPNTWFPLSVISKKQTSSTAHSTCEAEIVALSAGLRKEAIPTIQLWETLLNRKMELKIYEDNQSAITTIDNGYSAELRHVLKTQNVSIDALHTWITRDKIGEMEYIQTDKQVADIFTKQLEPCKWDAALKLLRIEKQERTIAKRDEK